MPDTIRPDPATRWKAGDLVAWDIGHGGTVVVRITSAVPGRITYESSDGCVEAAESTFAYTLDWACRRWRDATAEETAEFERRYRPAPHNWE
ncbi:hypothetical protein ACFRMQ_00050 [Kitasatospora sp. NPDC056783]|uniref:hypothetical protein n=1 Tax=Kitasatospora sp. NPDC056783 TaxID=3345943 RepID=UPI0036CBBF8D